MRSIPIILLGAFAVSLSLTSSADAQRRKGPPLVDMTEVDKLVPLRGFVDDPFTFDAAGGRLLYVNADAASLAELRVIDLAQRGVQLLSLDLSAVTTSPVDVQFMADGNFFVVGRPSRAEPAVAAIIDPSGAVLRKFGPATDIVLHTRDGEPVVVTYQRDEKKVAKGLPEVTHTVSIHAIADKGKRKQKPITRSLVANTDGVNQKLDFKISYWADAYTRVVGVKGGSWDAKEDQRSPNTEGWYDMVTGEFAKRLPIPNLIKHARRMQIMAQHDNEDDFVAAPDLSSLYYMSSTGAKTKVALAEPFAHYDPATLSYQPSRDGTMFFAIKIAPNNADAVARKKTDPEYLDLYEYRVGKNKAVRRARYLLTADSRGRKHSWRASGEFWVIVPRHRGFDRGGKQLQIYKLKR